MNALGFGHAVTIRQRWNERPGVRRPEIQMLSIRCQATSDAKWPGALALSSGPPSPICTRMPSVR